jgi:hypothetical protein
MIENLFLISLFKNERLADIMTNRTRVYNICDCKTITILLCPEMKGK